MVSRWLVALLSLSLGCLGCAVQSNRYALDEDAGAEDAEAKPSGPDDVAVQVDQPEPAERPGCAAGEVSCGGLCVDVSVSLQHCGRCDNPCAVGRSCVAGVCTATAPACAAPRQVCGTACVDVQSAPAHCGRCDNPCAAGQSCRAGVCTGATPACAAPRVVCGVDCVDVLTDAANCGICGLTCAAGQSCRAGVCAGGSCASPRVQCAGACVDVTSDAANCGACGLRCATGQTCSAGRCGGTSTGATRAGAACTNPDPMGGVDPACGALSCVPTGSLPMCTDNCSNSPSQLTERSMCGGGNATCLTQGDGPMANSLCLQACTPGTSTGCRPGFACTGWWYTHAGAVPDSPGCFPFCSSDAHCPAGGRCNLRLGQCGTTGADLTRRADGTSCDPTVTVMVAGEAQPRNIQCRGLCFRVSNTSPTQGICGSFVDLATARTCPDDPLNVPLLAPPGGDNLGLCIFRNCQRNANCAAPLICRYGEDTAGIPDRTRPPQCQYPTPAQRTGIP